MLENTRCVFQTLGVCTPKKNFNVYKILKKSIEYIRSLDNTLKVYRKYKKSREVVASLDENRCV